jgi:carbon monoxide dehydrogenase subunit G
MMCSIVCYCAQETVTVVRFESSIDIDASAERVWALIDRLEEWPQWMPSIKKIERVSKRPLGVGSQLAVTAKVSHLTIRLLMTIVEFVPERTVVMRGKAMGINLTRFYTLQPLDGKTRITVGGEVGGLLARLARRGGEAISAEIARAAKEKVEESE